MVQNKYSEYRKVWISNQDPLYMSQAVKRSRNKNKDHYRNYQKIRYNKKQFQIVKNQIDNFEEPTNNNLKFIKLKNKLIRLFTNLQNIAPEYLESINFTESDL